MADALAGISTRRTPQVEKAKAGQAKNAAGGYTFKIDDEARVRRFLTIGSTGGTYYTGEKELTRENADILIKVAESDKGLWLVETIVEISQAGRAPKQNPGIFGLAVCASLGSDEVRKAALDAVPKVCRTGTSLFLFAKYCSQFRGWGRGLRRAIGSWFVDKPVEDAAYQMIKYRQREGWSQRDLLRSAHPIITIPSGKALFNWTVNGNVETSRGPGGEQRPVGATKEDLPALIAAFEEAQAATNTADWVRLVEQFPLSWEMLPDAAVKQKEVWAALIQNKRLPIGAMVRQLPRLTNAGVFDDSDLLRKVVADLQDVDKLRKGRIHPINQLIALKTYAGGHSLRGSSTWSPKRQLVDALDASFYAAYGAIEPANKRFLIGLDVSGSMGSMASGLPISCRDLSAAIGLVTVATEVECDVIGFTGGWGGGRYGGRASSGPVTELAISPRQRLDDVIRTISGLDFGSTDCSLPFQWAQQHGKLYDCFIVITDGETYAGTPHPFQALTEYRRKTGIDAKSIVVAMTSTGFSIADPSDPGMLDVPGFDSSVPSLISSFARGDI